MPLGRVHRCPGEERTLWYNADVDPALRHERGRAADVRARRTPLGVVDPSEAAPIFRGAYPARCRWRRWLPRPRRSRLVSTPTGRRPTRFGEPSAGPPVIGVGECRGPCPEDPSKGSQGAALAPAVHQRVHGGVEIGGRLDLARVHALIVCPTSAHQRRGVPGCVGRSRHGRPVAPLRPERRTWHDVAPPRAP